MSSVNNNATFTHLPVFHMAGAAVALRIATLSSWTYFHGTELGTELLLIGLRILVFSL